MFVMSIKSVYDPSVNLRPIPPEDQRDEISPLERNCIIAVPKYHENLYRHVQHNFEWLRESINHTKRSGTHYRKKVKTSQDLMFLNQLITDLRTEKSELFIDFSFHAKPRNLPIREYINEFLRIKGIYSYYTFMGWYRITVSKESGDEYCNVLKTYNKGKDDERQEYPRREYLIIPLLIRLKKNKVFDQFKSVHYTNRSGTEYEIKSVNPSHFLRDDDPRSREQEDKMKEKCDSIFSKEVDINSGA